MARHFDKIKLEHKTKLSNEGELSFEDILIKEKMTANIGLKKKAHWC